MSDKDSKGELKPCPFCGGSAFKYDNIHEQTMGVACKKENCMGHNGFLEFETSEEAIKAWNTRPHSEPKGDCKKCFGAGQGWRKDIGKPKYIVDCPDCKGTGKAPSPPAIEPIEDKGDE